MVIVRDARSEFYHEVVGKRVLVFVLPDIDGLCAWRILKELFVSREVLYTLLVVSDKRELCNFYTKNKDAYHDIVLLNCGANFDVLEVLEPDTATIFYICDRYAIVGQTSQLLTNLINREHYVDQLDYLQSHVSRLGHAGNRANTASSVTEEGKAKVEIVLEDELALWLYKHWSLKETLETSMVTASKFKLFTEGGQKKMQEFLVHIGLSRRDLFLPSFTVQLGYRTPVSAIDAVFLTLSALECHGDGDPSVNFQRALDTLSCWSLPSLDNEITRAQAHLQSLASQVRNLIDTDEVVAFGPFLYAYLRKVMPIQFTVSACFQSSLVSIALRNTLSLSILSKYILMAKAALRPKLGRERRVVQMPLIFCVDSRADEENITLIGIPPLHGDDDRNLFGQAFEAAVRRTKARAEFCYFDTNCIELHREDMLKLFEALASLLS
ncbi:hypothetical protein T265_09664 [Opisthorchis viverrini]|uniref:CDC45-like protein n=1 Tax=Opisthorchis viverrini TaxID=6198 RepID=A0A074ZG29_OPIVI|nr:hypothetical protein T265_09664 [Opisthorchis viverrini]KER22180.1 hypothetical protein T265_09664 [Opisthorchis viverrini]